MYPYLKSGDVLFYTQDKKPVIGDLVYYKREDQNDFFVHRMISSEISKGDRMKQFDQDVWKNLQLQGVISGKLINNKMVSFETHTVKILHKVQAKISSFNTSITSLSSFLHISLLIV